MTQRNLLRFLSVLFLAAVVPYAMYVSIQTAFKVSWPVINGTIFNVPSNTEDTDGTVSMPRTGDVSLHHFRQGTKPEVHHVVLLKVHKTGSSTAQNIFLRFADSRNLTLVLANTRGETLQTNVISFRTTITSKNIVAPPKGKHYEMLCCHVLYNRTAFRKVLPEDTIYIGMVREPVSRFQSHIKFIHPGYIMRIPGDHPISTYAANPLKYEDKSPPKSWTNNRMALEYGFPEELFPGKSRNHSKADIDAYLRKIDKEFSFIIINERYIESIVYVRRLLSWKIKDIIFVELFAHKGEIKGREKVIEEDKKILSDFLYLDVALYQFALARFEDQIKKAGDCFQDEVEYFKEVLAQVDKFCKEKGKSKTEQVLYISTTIWNDEFNVTKTDCELMTMVETKFIQKERMRQYGTFNN